MWRLLKVLLYLAVLAAAAIVGYAFIGDLTPERRDMAIPVDLDAS